VIILKQDAIWEVEEGRTVSTRLVFVTRNEEEETEEEEEEEEEVDEDSNPFNTMVLNIALIGSASGKQPISGHREVIDM
jgi:hypothetical protein